MLRAQEARRRARGAEQEQVADQHEPPRKIAKADDPTLRQRTDAEEGDEPRLCVEEGRVGDGLLPWETQAVRRRARDAEHALQEHEPPKKLAKAEDSDLEQRGIDADEPPHVVDDCTCGVLVVGSAVSQ